MKKTLYLMLVLLALMLAACGQTDNGGSQSAAPGPAATGTAAIDSLKTMGDVFALGEMENEQNA